MKKYILIAAVNGAGKSTLFQALESRQKPAIPQYLSLIVRLQVFYVAIIVLKHQSKE